MRKWAPVRSYFKVFRSETKRPADFGHLWTFVNQTGCYTVHFKSSLVKSKSTRIKALSAKSWRILHSTNKLVDRFSKVAIWVARCS